MCCMGPVLCIMLEVNFREFIFRSALAIWERKG